MLLMTRALAEAHGWEIMGVFRSFAAVGCDPAVMVMPPPLNHLTYCEAQPLLRCLHQGIGPALAIPKAVEKAGIALADVDLFEINEVPALLLSPLLAL